MCRSDSAFIGSRRRPKFVIPSVQRAEYHEKNPLQYGYLVLGWWSAMSVRKRSAQEKKTPSTIRLVTPPTRPQGDLRPFFGYYGGKWRDALKHYPTPTYDTIVEPFAGSAGYSLRYAHLNIIICELDPVLAEVWRYLTVVKPSEIRAIPDVPQNGSVDDLKVCVEARWLVGFWLNRGVSTPRKRPSRWMRDGIRPGSFWGPKVRERIARQVEAIRHWKVHNCSYTDAPVPDQATWFVDPPYQQAGSHYRLGSDLLNYESLGIWCKSLVGQVIVCENAGADWLPFRELASVKTTRAAYRSKEVYWLNDFEPQQRRDARRR